MSDLKHLPLHALHAAHGAKFVPFAGFDMPVQYAAGVMAEHKHTREAAGCSMSATWGRCCCRFPPMPRWKRWCRST